MKIGLDMDGVVYDWHSAAYRFVCDYRGYSGTSFDFWTKDWWNLPKDEKDYIVSLETLYMSVFPGESDIWWLWKLSDLGEIFYVTARKPELRFITEKFLEKIDAPFKENLYLEKDKPTFCRLNSIDYFLDDFPEYVTALNPVTNAFLMSRAHNTGKRDGLNVVSSIREFYEVIKNGTSRAIENSEQN